MNNIERLAFWFICVLFVVLICFNGWCRGELRRIDADLSDMRAMVEERERWRAEASWQATRLRSEARKKEDCPRCLAFAEAMDGQVCFIDGKPRWPKLEKMSFAVPEEKENE